MVKKTFCHLLGVLSLCCTLCACSNRSTTGTLDDVKSAFTTVPVWYAADQTGLTRVDSPSCVPATELAPWTETLCITDAVCSGDSVFFLVNKSGIAEFSVLGAGVRDVFHKWDSRFNSATAASCHFYNGLPVVRLYRDSFFSTSNNNEFPPFLQWNRNTEVFSPLAILTERFFPEDHQLTAIEKTPDGYVALFKKDTDSAISFIYRRLIPTENATAHGYVKTYDITDITASEYTRLTALRSFERAPASVQHLLAYLQNIPFKLQLTIITDTAAGPESEPDGIYVNNAGKQLADTDLDAMPECFAVVSPTYCAALFSDGTFFYCLENNVPVAAKLPCPLENMCYRRFMVIGTILFAVWEESIFYETGRTGVLQMDIQR